MYSSDQLEVWNLAPDVPVWPHAQTTFNVVGRLNFPARVESFVYSLNGGSERPVYFNRHRKPVGRLSHFGDFNIDTISTRELSRRNQIVFRILDRHVGWSEHEIDFSLIPGESREKYFNLNLDAVDYPQQVGQVVDGRWQISEDEDQAPCLEIKPEDGGYDRILLFGHRTWDSFYEIKAQLEVTAWLGRPHNVGLLFKWNPHRLGDGAHLPSEWSTGLGYYVSGFPGLRFQCGVDVHKDPSGRRVGNIILKEAPLSLWRSYANGVLKRFFPTKNPIAQIIPGKRYNFRMRIRPEEYRLTVWREGRREPPPQLTISKPVEHLAQGSVGIIAHYCGVRLYQYEVSPIFG